MWLQKRRSRKKNQQKHHRKRTTDQRRKTRSGWQNGACERRAKSQRSLRGSLLGDLQRKMLNQHRRKKRRKRLLGGAGSDDATQMTRMRGLKRARQACGQRRQMSVRKASRRSLLPQRLYRRMTTLRTEEARREPRLLPQRSPRPRLQHTLRHDQKWRARRMRRGRRAG